MQAPTIVTMLKRPILFAIWIAIMAFVAIGDIGAKDRQVQMVLSGLLVVLGIAALVQHLWKRRRG